MENLITVVLPVYNGEETLPTCIESVQAQTYSGWNLFIVNDGSTDGTKKICEKYAETDNRIFVFNRENKGVSASRNYAIDRISTKYFVCVDSDDSVEPFYLELLINARTDYPEAGHIWCGFQTVENQSKLNPTPYLASSQKYVSFFDRKDIMELYSLWLAQMPWHRLYETDLVKKNNIQMDQALSLGEDLLFNLEYLDNEPKTKIVVINRPCYNYVRGINESLDSKYRADLKKIYEKLDQKIRMYLKKWDVNEENWKIFYNSCFYHYEKILRNTYHKKSDMSIAEKCKFNNSILQSEEFQEILSKRQCYVHPAYLFAYSRKSCLLLWLLDKIAAVKNM